MSSSKWNRFAWAPLTFLLDAVAGIIIFLKAFNLHGPSSIESIGLMRLFLFLNAGILAIFLLAKEREAFIGFILGALLPFLAVLTLLLISQG